MNKLRRAYPEIQADARNNFDKVTLERAKMLSAYANKQMESQVEKEQFANIYELSFYQDKFKALIDLFNNAIANKTKKSKLQADIVQLLNENYIPQGQPTPAPLAQKQQLKPSKIEQQGMKKDDKQGKNPKDILNSFFDYERSQIEKNKVGFKSVLDTMPKTAPKPNVKSSMNVVRQNNNEQIQVLSSEIKALSKKLQDQKQTSHFNQGLYEAQKEDYENRIRDLVIQIDKLNRQNEKIRQQPAFNANIAPSHLPVETKTKVIYEHRLPDREDYSPYSIKYRDNDLLKIKQKINNNHEQKIEFQAEEISPVPVAKGNINRIELLPKKQEDDLLENVFQNDRIELQPIRYDSQFERSNIQFGRSEVENQGKNIAVRSKLSFFKREIVLYRGQYFEVAIKSHDLLELSSRKISIYVNNRDKFDRTASITYLCDPSYYELLVNKKLRELKGCKQSKEEIEVRLKDKKDFDSMIEAKLTVHTSSISIKEIKFLIPAMFIEFVNRKPQVRVKELYEKNLVTPIFQFSSIYSAMEAAPFEKYYEDKIEVASIFARSKYHQGYINIRWKVKGEIEIETIKPWSLLFSYLFSKEY